MKTEENGDQYQEHLLAQYRLYVEMADRVSQRREQTNRFYVTLLSAIVAVFIVPTRFGFSAEAWNLIVGILGGSVSLSWIVNILSYRILNSAKFKIIHDIEIQLPHAGFTKEWEILQPKNGPPRYLQLTKIEQAVPSLCLVLFIGIVVQALISMIGTQ